MSKHNCFKNHGFRITVPRKAILEVLSESDEYLSAEEVYMIVHNKYPNIGMATVYRTLNLLSDMGMVTRYEFGEGKARFELAEQEKQREEEEHFHQLICTDCFKVIKYSDFSEQELELMNKIEHTLEDKYDFDIQRHIVQFYGVCPDCR
jgi:Fur family ferric uptake transcriptional regulator